MKHTFISRTLILFAALAGSAALRAQDSILLPWERVCQYANNVTPNNATPKTIQIKTLNGETVEGVCYSVNVDELSVKTDHGIVTIARAQLSRIRVSEIKPHRQLAHLGKQVGRGIKHSAEMIPTPFGLAGLIGIPSTIAAGAVGAPFALLGDLFGYTKTMEIKIR